MSSLVFSAPPILLCILIIFFNVTASCYRNHLLQANIKFILIYDSNLTVACDLYILLTKISYKSQKYIALQSNKIVVKVFSSAHSLSQDSHVFFSSTGPTIRSIVLKGYFVDSWKTKTGQKAIRVIRSYVCMQHS